MFRPDFPFSVGLSFSGHDGTTLEAYGVTLLVDGFMEPISLDHCCNVTLLGLTIDHLRKPYSHGVIERYEISEKTFSTLIQPVVILGNGRKWTHFSDSFENGRIWA